MATDFSQIQFNEKFHTYTLNGQRMDNVTKFIKQFQQPFDQQAVANKVAAREGRAVDEIIAEWNAKGDVARALGIRVHAHIQGVLTGQIKAADPFTSLNSLVPEEEAFNELWESLKHRVTVNPMNVEMIIGDEAWNIAGTVDSILYSSLTGRYHIWDWKTGKFDVNNPWQKLLPPFADLPDCKLNYYSLQISLYKLILQRNTDMPLGDSYLVHLSPDGQYQVHQVIDLAERLKAVI